MEIGTVIEGTTGRRFALAEVERSGYRFWSIDFGLLLTGIYSKERFEQMVASGALKVTEERFDVEAAERAATEARFERLRGAAAVAQQVDAEKACERQLERTLGPIHGAPEIPSGDGSLNVSQRERDAAEIRARGGAPRVPRKAKERAPHVVERKVLASAAQVLRKASAPAAQKVVAQKPQQPVIRAQRRAK
jgi:hypothetical protein